MEYTIKKNTEHKSCWGTFPTFSWKTTCLRLIKFVGEKRIKSKQIDESMRPNKRMISDVLTLIRHRLHREGVSCKSCCILCRAAGWCPGPLQNGGWLPSLRPGGESRTESLWRSTGKGPPLRQRRLTAGSSWGSGSAWGDWTEKTSFRFFPVLPPSGCKRKLCK